VFFEIYIFWLWRLVAFYPIWKHWFLCFFEGLDIHIIWIKFKNQRFASFKIKNQLAVFEWICPYLKKRLQKLKKNIRSYTNKYEKKILMVAVTRFSNTFLIETVSHFFLIVFLSKFCWENYYPKSIKNQIENYIIFSIKNLTKFDISLLHMSHVVMTDFNKLWYINL
jgi:hypothetical protein